MENEEQIEVAPFDDSAIKELVEVLKEEQELKKAEIEANEENILQAEETDKDIQDRIETLEANNQVLTETLEALTGYTLQVTEQLEETNDLIAEGSFITMLTIVCAISLYAFFNQIFKW